MALPVRRACGLCCTRLVGISVTLGGQAILSDVNLHIHCGELTAIVGPNGAGKTTLLKALIGELPHAGQLSFVDAKEQHTGKPLIGYVPQRLDFDSSAPLSVLDLFAAANRRFPVFLGASRAMRRLAGETLDHVQAAHLLDRRLGALSGGELQRVLLALALHPLPDLLLLDEPVSAVDTHGMELFYTVVAELRRQLDLSVILVSHDLPLVVRYADRLVLLNRTVVAAGAPQEILARQDLAREFGFVPLASPPVCPPLPAEAHQSGKLS